MIFARKTTWRSRLDLEYLGETSSRKFSTRRQQTMAAKEPGRSGSSPTTPQFLHHLILINKGRAGKIVCIDMP